MMQIKGVAYKTEVGKKIRNINFPLLLQAVGLYLFQNSKTQATKSEYILTHAPSRHIFIIHSHSKLIL